MRRITRDHLRTALLAGTTALAVALPALSGGGFGAAAQASFIALAGLALLVSAILAPGATLAAARSAPALILASLAMLAIVSAAWTYGDPTAALRSGLTIAGYAALLTAGAALTDRAGPLPLAGGIALLASLEAVLGLRAAYLHAPPYAEPIAGAWRPGGTFEYPPALALLEVGAIPVLGVALGHAAARALPHRSAGTGTITAGRVTAGAVAAGGVMAGAALALMLVGAALGLADSRIAWGLAVVALATLALRAGLRHARFAPALLLGTGAIAAHLLVPHTVRAVPASERSAVRSSQPESSADPLHGRLSEWRTAGNTWLGHPLVGVGAGAYFTASLPYQDRAPVIYAHDLPVELAAELGIAGLLLCVALYVGCITAVHAGRGDPGMVMFDVIVVAFLISNLLDWTWHLAGLGAIWAAALGGSVALRRASRPLV